MSKSNTSVDSRQAQPPQVLYHYTNKAGYDGIMASKSIFPSTVDGIKNTHYGKGVYFTPLSPEEIGMYKDGAYESTRRIFSDVTTYSVDHMQYYIGVHVDRHWQPLVARDPKLRYEINDIWLVPGADAALNINAQLLYHGTTVKHRAIAELGARDTAARDYAFQLNKQHNAPEQQEQKWQRPKPSEFIFIGGHTVRRQAGQDDDFLHQEGYTPN
ncbi:hypothetical protein F5B20DRAFT_335595 [Whalleya microplaca]|nr:hypothetical protein F5B20DRAFT_335595 [Whalleya microplaca]